jgi:hypothetical protein
VFPGEGAGGGSDASSTKLYGQWQADPFVAAAKDGKVLVWSLSRVFCVVANSKLLYEHMMPRHQSKPMQTRTWVGKRLFVYACNQYQ